MPGSATGEDGNPVPPLRPHRAPTGRVALALQARPGFLSPT
jgi:hypothetical protein